jgi:transcription antitermination factor NusA-like protein
MRFVKRSALFHHRMPFIEVFNPTERSFYRAELHGVTGKFANVIFEGGEQARVETRYIRPEPAPAPDGYAPQLNAGVEVRFHMDDQAPSYWEGTVHKIIGKSQALVKFPDPTFNDVYDFDRLRPATGLMVGESVFEYVPVPSDCHDDFMEHNKRAIDFVHTTSRLISLCFVPAKRALALYGVPPAVSEAKSLLSVAFARSGAINQAAKKSAARGGKSTQQAVETFVIPTSLVKFAMGKGGKNIIEIKRSLELHEVTFVKVAEDESQTLVSVFADSKEKGEHAKRQLNFVEHSVQIQDRDHIRAIIGPSGTTIRDMKRETQVPVIIVKDEENPPHIIIQGLKDGVDQCAKMIDIICLYEPQVASLEGALQRAGAAQRFQSFQRQQRSSDQQRRQFSAEDFPALPAGQPGGKQTKTAAAAPDRATVASEDAAPPLRSARGGGRGGRGGKSRAEHESEDPVPVVPRGGGVRRGESRSDAPSLRGKDREALRSRGRKDE